MKFNWSMILLNIVLALGAFTFNNVYGRFVALEQENSDYDDKLENVNLAIMHLNDKVEFLEEQLKLKVVGGKE